MSVENFPEPWQKKLADLATAYGVEIESLTVTENGTYSEEGKAYSPVIVNVSGGGTTEYDIKCYVSTDDGATYTEDTDIVYEAEWSPEDYIWVKKEDTEPLTKSIPGITLVIDNQEGWNTNALYELGGPPDVPVSNNVFVMPAHSVDIARYILH